MYSIFKPLLFALSPEAAHRITFQLLDIAAAFPPTHWLLRRLFCISEKRLEKKVLGLTLAIRN